MRLKCFVVVKDKKQIGPVVRRRLFFHLLMEFLGIIVSGVRLSNGEIFISVSLLRNSAKCIKPVLYILFEFLLFQPYAVQECVNFDSSMTTTCIMVLVVLIQNSQAIIPIFKGVLIMVIHKHCLSLSGNYDC